MTYRIGICEDDAYFLELLKVSLQKYEQSQAITLQILTYSTGDELLASYGEQHFNLLILDMEMPGLNGIEVAKELRRFDSNINIIYSTIHEDFALQAFQVAADAYLVKPFADTELFDTLNRIFDKLNLQANFQALKDTYLTFEVKKEIIQLPYDEIIYVTKVRNSLTIYTPTQEYIVYMNIKDIRERLDPSIFVKINPGQIINWSKVTLLANNLIYLDDLELSVSRSYATKLNKRYRQESEQLLRINEHDNFFNIS